MTDLADIRSLAVLGLGSSGRAAALLAARRLTGVAVTALDAKREEELGATPAELRSAGVALDLGPQSRLPEGVDLLVKSPGVPNESPVVRAALARGVPIWGEFEFAYRFLDATTIAITGTNGKTTTTELTGAILAGAGLPVVVAGNVGHPIALVPGHTPPGAIVVAEVSSFQMEYVERFQPRVAVLLNLTEDHLDRHGTYAGYVAAKLRVFENQSEGDLALLNGDDPGVAAELEGRPAGGPAARRDAKPRRVRSHVVQGRRRRRGRASRRRAEGRSPAAAAWASSPWGLGASPCAPASTASCSGSPATTGGARRSAAAASWLSKASTT